MMSDSRDVLPVSSMIVFATSARFRTRMSIAPRTMRARSDTGTVAHFVCASRALAIALATSAGLLTTISPIDSRVAGLRIPSRRRPSEVGESGSTMAIHALLSVRVLKGSE